MHPKHKVTIEIIIIVSIVILLMIIYAIPGYDFTGIIINFLIFIGVLLGVDVLQSRNEGAQNILTQEDRELLDNIEKGKLGGCVTEALEKMKQGAGGKKKDDSKYDVINESCANGCDDGEHYAFLPDGHSHDLPVPDS